MDKNANISLIAMDATIYDYAYKVAKGNDLYRDIVSDVLIYLYDLPEDKFNQIKDLKSYVCKMIYFSWNSSTSPFYKKYRTDYDIKVDEKAADSECWLLKELEQIEIRISKKRYPTEVMLFQLYSDLGDYRSVSQKVGIPTMTVYKLVNKVRNEMKKKI